MIHYLSFEALAEKLGVSSRQARHIVKAHRCQVVKFYGFGSRVRVSDEALGAMRSAGDGRRWYSHIAK